MKIDVVAIDLAQADLHWVVGSKDDEAGKFSGVMAAGVVPEAEWDDTVLVFNGGFQPRHGRWGIVAHGVTLQPPKDEGCVVAIERTDSSSSVWLGPWADRPGTTFDVVRQTPPCLFVEGELHPALLQGNDRLWGGQDPTRRTRRRSALGLDATGKILYYALGVETEPIDLARGLLAAGARSALQLDINWNWTRCLAPARDEDGRVRVREALVEGMPFGKNEYFGRPSERDFFFVTRRQ